MTGTGGRAGPSSGAKKGKVLAPSSRLTAAELSQLDRSVGGPGAAAAALATAAVAGITAEQRRAVGSGSQIRDDVRGLPAAGTEPAADKGLFRFFSGLAGATTITAEALAPVLEQTRLHLISKNVAADVAENLAEALKQGLVGQTKGSFRGLASLVQENLEQALTRILSPKQRVNILGDIIKRQQQKRPYVAVFCGVNGVGKSTNLAKICFWLLENKKSICIAAGDTFRAGAVEQVGREPSPFMAGMAGTAVTRASSFTACSCAPTSCGWRPCTPRRRARPRRTLFSTKRGTARTRPASRTRPSSLVRLGPGLFPASRC